MKNQGLKLIVYAACLAASLLLVEFGWSRSGSFFGLLIASLAGVAMMTWASSKPLPVQAALGDAAVDAAGDGPSLWGHGLAALGAASLALAWWLLLRDQPLAALLAILGGALCWWPLLPLRTEPGLSRRALGVGMGLAMAAAAVFRFYKAGEIPAGLITVDEPRLMNMAIEVLKGVRATFHTGGSEGYATIWVEAACMWLFGHDITGFRMAALIPGLMLVGMLGLLGLELLGSRAGLMAAGLTAVCVWPVAFSRQEYLQSSSYMPMVGAILFYLRGLRRSSRFELVLAGFWLGLCFNVYSPSRLIPLLLILLSIYLWLQRPGWRASMLSAWQPLLGGLIVGLAPLLLWFARDPQLAMQSYFGKLDLSLLGGAEVQQAQGLLAKFDVTFRNILPGLPKLLTMFTTHGGMRPWFFKLDQPVIDQATLFLLLCGLAVSLVRFRQLAYPFLIAWWLLGLTPTLLAQPQYHMDERRIMLNMPATLLLAAVGLHGLLSLALRGWSRPRADKAMAAACLAFFTLFAINSWRTYFYDMELDPVRRAFSHANYDNGLRAIFRENAKGPVYAISMRKAHDDNWQVPGVQNELEEHTSILTPIPYKFAALDAAYFTGQGLFGLLRQQPASKDEAPAPDPVILLTPFHYYLEPFLVKELGGERVAEVPLVRTPKGPDYADVGMALDPKSSSRLVRLRGFTPEKLKALEERWLFPVQIQELSPPPALGTRELVQKTFLHDPPGVKMMEDYAKAPQRWRGGTKIDLRLEPWWWTTSWALPTVHPPYRMSAAWGLQVPADGLYRFGLSATPTTTIKVDGKPVVSFMPRAREDYPLAKAGVWGEAIELKAGTHRLDIDAMMLNESGYFTQLVRVLWERPDGSKETLPMELLLPTPPR